MKTDSLNFHQIFILHRFGVLLDLLLLGLLGVVVLADDLLFQLIRANLLLLCLPILEDLQLAAVHTLGLSNIRQTVKQIRREFNSFLLFLLLLYWRSLI